MKDGCNDEERQDNSQVGKDVRGGPLADDGWLTGQRLGTQAYTVPLKPKLAKVPKDMWDQLFIWPEWKWQIKAVVFIFTLMIISLQLYSETTDDDLTAWFLWVGSHLPILGADAYMLAAFIQADLVDLYWTLRAEKSSSLKLWPS